MLYNFRTVAHVETGRIWLSWGATSLALPHIGSIAQGKRFAERWIAAREGLPGQKRATRMREDAQAKQERKRELDARWRELERQPHPAPLPTIMLGSSPEEPSTACIDISADLLAEYHDTTDGWA